MGCNLIPASFQDVNLLFSPAYPRLDDPRMRSKISLASAFALKRLAHSWHF
jgi:hypothetical protein